LTTGRCHTFGQCESANTEESCTDYTNAGEGTDCGLCESCNANGECNQIPTDDSTCGIIDCDGLDTTCRNYDDLTTGRCLTFGQCKSQNSADCNVYTNAGEGTDCGICKTCDGQGSCGHLPLDDSDCGIIDCDGLNTGCRDYSDLTSDRCGGFGTCESPNSGACIFYTDTPNCCNSNGDCHAPNICTSSICSNSHVCVNTPIQGCCLADSDCKKGMECTNNVCRAKQVPSMSPVAMIMLLGSLAAIGAKSIKV